MEAQHRTATPLLPEIALADPVGAVHTISHDPLLSATVPLVDGRELTAVQVQRAYLEALRTAADLADEETAQVLTAWSEILDLLEQDPMLAADRVEWLGNSDDDYQLVSITKKIKNTNALSFFESAKYINKNRTFWMSSEEDFYLVGIGQSYEIIAEESRFEETKKAWNQLLEKATIYNPYEQPGTGIVALGGLSFDPKKPTTPLWENFKDVPLSEQGERVGIFYVSCHA
ncbi:proteasome accessory factor PafA2 family protein, partial [Herbaspirillum sp. VT-16-41]|uniref:proteasome accessory factor PafA2 family protein n=1 Tax=Herbaspirillum sp. VT-16-41 TaxID=1953765 RepID=UPI0020C5568A